MKLGVSSYSFAGAVKSGQIDYLDIPAKAAEIGFDEIEFSAFILPDGETTSGFAEKVEKACREAGIPIANYTIAGDLLGGSEGILADEIQRLKGEVDVAAILGSPGMRHDAAWRIPAGYPHYTGFDDVLPRLAEGCRGVTEYAAGLGIKTMVENHGQFAQESSRVEKLVRTVAHDNFGVLMDIGNFICADEDPIVAAGRLMPYATHVHAKDMHWKSGNEIDPGEGWSLSRGGNYWRGAIAGHGDVDLFQVIKKLKEVGYHGTLSIEFEGLEDSIKGIKIGYANLRRFLAMIGT
jgi:sugar phosphate isomerase/epimerase